MLDNCLIHSFIPCYFIYKILSCAINENNCNVLNEILFLNEKTTNNQQIIHIFNSLLLYTPSESASDVGMAHIAPPTNTNFQITFLVT